MTSQKTSSWTLSLLALGVVFGDIGTSPLYALRECLAHGRFEMRNPVTVLGPVSLMIWSLAIIAMVKYLLILTRADNHGEGGTFALYGLIRQAKISLGKTGAAFLGTVVMLAAAMMYGDGIITPAISVLSAVEGLEYAHVVLPEWATPMIAAGIIVLIFSCQRFGTAKIGVGFGPIMMVWFATLAVMGVVHLLRYPDVLRALSPHYGIAYLVYEKGEALHVMGTVLLAVTGCEALYADIGHFGRSAMKRAWFVAAYPALTLNYLGQGALLLHEPEAINNPFFHMVSESLRIPLVVLATLATVIASQAMITGVFSLTQQALQLGFLPRMKIVHTSPDVKGQIYMPQVNLLLMCACLCLVAVFQTSSSLASAYGLSVSTVMVLSSVLLYQVMRNVWEWPRWKALPLVCFFLMLELGYWLGSVTKLLHGAWVPMVIALVLWVLMKTWKDGRAILFKRVTQALIPVSHVVDELKAGNIIRVPGIGVFLSSSSSGLPLVLLHHLKHNKALHETAILLTVKFEEASCVSSRKRIEITELHPSFFRIVLHYGFAESPNVRRDFPDALKRCGVKSTQGISYYQSRELLLTNGPGKMAPWRKRLFAAISRMARPATGYFNLPPNQVIELGIQLEL